VSSDVKHLSVTAAALSLEGAKLLRLPEVCSRVGMRRTSIYALISEGRFPPPVKVGGASAWVDREITLWIEGLVASRDASARGRGRGRNATQTPTPVT
jgi:prophage regulatory protein